MNDTYRTTAKRPHLIMRRNAQGVPFELAVDATGQRALVGPCTEARAAQLHRDEHGYPMPVSPAAALATPTLPYRSAPLPARTVVQRIVERRSKWQDRALFALVVLDLVARFAQLHAWWSS